VTTDLIAAEQLLPALKTIRLLAERGGDRVTLHTVATVEVQGVQLPVYALVMGSKDPNAPAIGLFGGIHGVERIGTEVVLAYLQSLVEGLHWSSALRDQISQMHIVIMPIVNPGSMVKNHRSNPNGVDLMRNAPIDAEHKIPLLLGGHRISRKLPWYRGKEHAPMEIEAQALCQVVEEHLLNRPVSMAVDFHSGYGRKDYLWLPYAYTRKPFPFLAEMYALKSIFDRTYPNHTQYTIEPQSLHYTTHGDLWDYLHIKSLANKATMFLPLTLEMGSWRWIKKNPRQLLKFGSLFNPILPHRQQRILRRHLVLIEFLLRAAHGHQNWIPKGDERIQLTEQALRLWYPDHV
jgi:hypothetical protein